MWTCYKCGTEEIFGGQFVNLDQTDVFVAMCPKCLQPERSKREDLFEQMQDEMTERSKLNIAICKAQLGCGALNTTVTP